MAIENKEQAQCAGILHYLLHSTGTLLALSVFVPAFFILVQNSHMFPIEYFAYATLTVLAVSSSFLAIGICWDNGVKHLPFSTLVLNVKSIFLILMGIGTVIYIVYSPSLSIYKITNQNIIFCGVFFVLGVLFYAGTQRIAPCLKFCLLLLAIFIPLYLISNFYLLESDWASERNAEFLFGAARIFLITLYWTGSFILGVVLNTGMQRIPLSCGNISLGIPVPIVHLSSILVGIASALLIFYYSLPTKTWFESTNVLYVFYVLVVGLFAFVSLKFTKKFITLFLVIFLGISLVRLSMNLYFDYKTEINASYEGFISEKIEKKPNIYLFYLESYNDLGTMQEIFGMDTSALTTKLIEQKYTIYENGYSNGPYTLASMYTCFTAQPEYLDIHRGYADVSMLGRSIFGGSTKNMLFSFLKDNGYKTITYLDPPSYFFYGRGPLADENSFPENDYSSTKKAGIALRPTAPFIMSILRTMLLANTMGHGYFSMAPKVIIEKIKQIKDSELPTLFVFKKGAFHSPSGLYDWTQSQRWVDSNYYQNRVESSNKEVFAIVDAITKHDPDAVVILMGDHGAIRLRKIDEGCSNVEELNKKLVDNGFTLKELIQDRFGIFLAVKMPDYAQQDISFGHSLITPANLFRHIFAALDHNPKFLENRTEDAFYLDYSRLKLTMDDVKE